MQITQTSITQNFFISLESLSYQELTVNLLWVKVCRIGCMTLEDVIAPSNYWKIWLTTVISITHFVIVVLVLCVWGCAIFRWWSKLVCTFLLILSKGKISKLIDHLWRQVGQVFRALVLKSGGFFFVYSWLVCLLPVGVLQAMRLWSFTVFISNFFELIVWKNCYYPIWEFSSPRSLLDTLCFLFAFYLETFWWPCFCLFAHGWMCFLFWKKGKSCRLCCDHIEHLDFMDR